ncbi:MAG: hypothetical protein JST00_46575 [Deltaproteobacteria bacterium]|nr:hypothetical protein [Deltaproteobacteria bacterium]
MGTGLSRVVGIPFVGVSLLLASSAMADDTWLVSVDGPGPKRVRGAAAIGLLAVQGPQAGPGGTLALAVGASEIVDFRAELDMAGTFGSPRPLAVGSFEPHLLFRPLGKRSPQGNIGLKVGPEILFAGGKNRESLVFGLTPGLAVSTGTTLFQFTTGIDFPIYLAAAGDLADTKVTPAIRVALTLEWALGEALGIFTRWAPVMSHDNGFLFFSHTVGLTF